MAYNGSGTFVVNTAGQPVVPNTVISATAFNALTNDLANGLSTCITKDGQTTPTANIPMGNNKITGLAPGTSGTDAANLSQVQGSTAKLLQSVTGTDTITAAMVPALTSYSAGQMFYFVAAGDNTGAVTINIDSLGAKSVTRDGSTALVAGDIVSGEVALIVYDGTRFQLLNGNSFTNLNVSNNLTLSGGTANGVLYLNGSKVATSGSALTFDGTNLTTTGRLNTGANLGLLLNNATGAYALWQYNGTNVGEIGTANQLIGGGGTDDFAINTRQAAGDILFAINTTEGMRLTSTGLGIGTASPAYKLHVATNSGFIAGFQTTAASDYRPVSWFNSAGSAVGDVGLDITNTLFKIRAIGMPLVFGSGADGTDRMRLDSSGNLGLGVTPSAWGTTKALEFSYGSFSANSSLGTDVAGNCYYNGTNWIYRVTGVALRYNQATAGHSWHVASGTAGNPITFTQALTLDASGNLGLGTTTADIFSLGFARNSTVAVTGAGTTAAVNISGGAASRLVLGVGSTRYGQIYQDSSNYMEIVTTAALPIVFSTDSTQRARITAGGYFKASDTGTYRNSAGVYHELRNSDGSNPTVFVTSSNASTPYGIAVEFTAAAPDNNTQFFFRAEDTGAVRCYIWADGDLANHDGVYGTISDERLKQDIVDAGSQWDDLKSIRFRKYRMKTDVEANPDAPAMFGVVAQELAQVCPGLVDEHPNMKTVEVTDEEGNVTQTQEPDGTTTMTVKSSILLMKAAKALQEAMARIESLEADVAALKGAK